MIESFCRLDRFMDEPQALACVESKLCSLHLYVPKIPQGRTHSHHTRHSNRQFPRQNVDRTRIAHQLEQRNDSSSRKTRFLHLPTIHIPILTDNLPILLTMDNSMAARAKIGHATPSAPQPLSGFIIALRNIYENFIFWRLVI